MMEVGREFNVVSDKEAAQQSNPEVDGSIELEFNGRKYTRRQLEHLGDAVLSVAARDMVHEHIGVRQHHLYFTYSCLLVSNHNLGGKQEARKKETHIGRVYVENGILKAIEQAKLYVRESSEWEHFLRACMDFRYHVSRNLKGTQFPRSSPLAQPSPPPEPPAKKWPRWPD